MNLGAIPFIFLLTGIIIFTRDPDFGTWTFLAGVLAAIAEYLLLPQRLVVTTAGFQPQLMRYKAMLKGSRFVPWDCVTAIWPLYSTNPLNAETELRGFEATVPVVGTTKLSPTRSLSGKAKPEHLESAVRESLGPRLNAVWREIPGISSNDIESMRKVLMTSYTKESVSGLAQIYVPMIAFMEIQAFYVMLNKRMLNADQVCFLAILMMAVSAILALIMFVNLYRLWKRRQVYAETLSLYFQVRRYEEKSGKHLLPQMQMLARYRKLDPRPAPVETYKGHELLGRLRRLNIKAYSWIGASLIVPLAALQLVFTYHLSLILLLLVLPIMPAAVLLGASNLFEAQNVVTELKMIVHEEWKTGQRYLPEKADLRIWGIQRDPVKLMGKSLPRLRAIVSRKDRIAAVISTSIVILIVIMIALFALSGKAQTFVLVLSLLMLLIPFTLLIQKKIAPEIRDPAVRTILEYEEVTGRQLLPPELASLREKRKAG